MILMIQAVFGWTLRQWDNALRSLCAEAGIDIAGVVLESYPRRLTLFGPQ